MERMYDSNGFVVKDEFLSKVRGVFYTTYNLRLTISNFRERAIIYSNRTDQ